MSFVTGALSSTKMLGLEDSGEIAEKGASLMGKEGEEEQRRENGHDGEEDGEEERLNRQMSEMSLYGTEEEEDEEGKSAKGIELGPRVSLKTEIEKDKDDDSLRRWKEQLLGSVDLNSVGVDRTKEMLGTFSPQPEPYTYETPEETTPSGLFARGSYSARTKLNTETAVCLLRTEPSCISSLMMMASATWRSITALTYAGNGHQLDENTTSAALSKSQKITERKG
ncbi:hypothetical protein GW17_00010786 [Ensete ventricosum]|nr:hypothetical protein GW17_00010786 [Ensete ventricosum]RZR82311.1 hypothetical protein BHM03_00008697 [Ensete ventricosum]